MANQLGSFRKEAEQFLRSCCKEKECKNCRFKDFCPVPERKVSLPVQLEGFEARAFVLLKGLYGIEEVELGHEAVLLGLQRLGRALLEKGELEKHSLKVPLREDLKKEVPDFLRTLIAGVFGALAEEASERLAKKMEGE